MAHFTSADLAEIERQCRVAVDLTDAQQAALLRLTNIRDPRMLSVDEARELVFCITSMTDSSGQIAVIHALRDLAAREVFQGAPRRHGRDHYAEMVRIVVDIPHIIVPMSELMCDLAMLRVSRTRMIAAGTHEACASMIHTSEPREPVVPALTVLTRLFVHSRNDRDDYTALARLNLFRAFENVFDTGREEEPQPRALRVALAQASLFAVHRRRVAVANERLLTAWTRLLSAMIVHDDALRIHDHERNALLFATQNLFRFARERDVPAILTAIRRWVEVETPGILAWCLEAELLDRIVERFQLRLPLEREQPSSQERRDIQEQSLRLVNSILRFLDQYQGDQMYRNLFLNLLKAQNIQACYMNGESDLADFYSVLASNLARYP